MNWFVVCTIVPSGKFAHHTNFHQMMDKSVMILETGGHGWGWGVTYVQKSLI
jgi:hypothetical protein